jgi:hypothetical protein
LNKKVPGALTKNRTKVSVDFSTAMPSTFVELFQNQEQIHPFLGLDLFLGF